MERNVLAAQGFERVKRCWQSTEANATIRFLVPSSAAIMIAYYQNVHCTDAEVTVDGVHAAVLPGYFAGYEWRPGSGRNQIWQLPAQAHRKPHVVTVRVLEASKSQGPARRTEMVQVVAILTNSKGRNRRITG